MPSTDHPDVDSKHITALGVWRDNFSTISFHKGSTFHNLSLGKRFDKLVLNLEESVFALLRTNFLLIDYYTKNVLTPDDILSLLYDSGRVSDLLKVHVYLAFQRLGMCPISLQDSIPSSAHLDPKLCSLDDLTIKHEKVELHSLLDIFRSRKFTNFSLRAELPYPVYSVGNLECFITMPDSPSHIILDSLPGFNKIIAVSNMDSVYFLTLSPIIF